MTERKIYEAPTGQLTFQEQRTNWLAHSWDMFVGGEHKNIKDIYILPDEVTV